MALGQGGRAIVLRRGSSGDEVGELQELLVGKGFDISTDRDSGPATELAVRMLQKNGGLAVDGIVGRRTWALLRS